MSDKKERMNKETTDLLLDNFPQMKNIRNIRKFFGKGLHIKFERADTLNRTDWFEHANEKYGECMKAHAEGVGSVFDMSNYWNWYNEKV